MRKLLIAAMSTGTLLGTMAFAQAMPMAGGMAISENEITQVAYGCGPGFHPNPWGSCVPNGYGYGRPVYRAPVYRAPVYRGPVYRAPIYRAPVYRGPAYRAPIHRAPVHRAPVYRY